MVLHYGGLCVRAAAGKGCHALELGGTVLGSVRHPTNTADFSSFVLQAQSSKANVVAFANAGQDTDNAIKQSGEFGLVQSARNSSVF